MDRCLACRPSVLGTHSGQWSEERRPSLLWGPPICWGRPSAWGNLQSDVEDTACPWRASILMRETQPLFSIWGEWGLRQEERAEREWDGRVQALSPLLARGHSQCCQ